MAYMSQLPEQDERVENARPRRPWSQKFRDALRGLKFGVRGHSSFCVHFFVAALVIVGAFALGCDASDWAVLLLCIGLVLTAELFNCLETCAARPETRTHRALDTPRVRC